MKMQSGEDSSGDDSLYGVYCHSTEWVVKFSRRGIEYAKTFAFSTHGGKAAARAHAVAWRDAQLAAHPPMTMEQRSRHLRPDNKSGYPGVACLKDENGVPRRWVARTQIGSHKPLMKSFSIKKYGDRGAQAMAIAERERQLEQVQGYLIHNPAALIDESNPPPAYPAPHLAPKSLRTTTPGVHINRGRNGKAMAWIAETHRGEYHARESFSIIKHGNAQAEAMAIAERKRQLKEARRNNVTRKRA